jgi:hypothetical protein
VTHDDLAFKIDAERTDAGIITGSRAWWYLEGAIDKLMGRDKWPFVHITIEEIRDEIQQIYLQGYEDGENWE